MSDFEKLRSDAIAKIDISLKFIEGVSQIDEAKKKFLRRRLDALRAEIKESKCNCSDEIMKQSMYNQLRQTVDKALKEIFSTTHSTVYVENEMTYHPINQEMLFVTREQAARITALERDILRFQRIIAERDAAINRLTNINNGLAAGVRELRRELTASQNQTVRFMVQNHELQRLIETLQRELAIEREKSDFKNHRNVILNDQLDASFANFRELYERKQLVSDRLDSCRASYGRLRALYAEEKKKVVQLDEENKGLLDLTAQLQAERDAFAVYVLKIYQSFRKLSGDGSLADTKDAREAMEGYELIERYIKIVMGQLQELLGNHGGNLVGIYGKLGDALTKLSDKKIPDNGQGAHNALLEAYTELKAMHDQDRERYDRAAEATEATYTALQGLVDRYRKENSDQRTELQNLRNNLNRLRGDLEDATNKLAACVERLASAEGKLETCQQVNTEKDATIAELRQEIERMRNAQQEQKQRADAENILIGIYQRLHEIYKLLYPGKNADDNRVIDEISKGVQQLLNINATHAVLLEATAEGKYQKQAPDAVVMNANNAQRQLNKMKKDLDDAKTENAGLEREISEMDKQLMAITLEKNRLTEANKKNEQLIKNLQVQLATHQDRKDNLGELQAQLQQQADRVETLDRQNRELNTAKEKWAKEKKEYEAEFDVLRADQIRYRKLKEQKISTAETLHGNIAAVAQLFGSFVKTVSDALGTLAENWGKGSKELFSVTFRDLATEAANLYDKTIYEDDIPDEVDNHIAAIQLSATDLANYITHTGSVPPSPDNKTGSGEQFHHTKHVSPYEPRYTGGAVESTPPTSAISYLIGLIILLVIYILYAVVSWLIESPRKKRPKVLFVNCKSADSVNPSKIEIAPLSVE